MNYARILWIYSQYASCVGGSKVNRWRYTRSRGIKVAETVMSSFGILNFPTPIHLPEIKCSTPRSVNGVSVCRLRIHGPNRSHKPPAQMRTTSPCIQNVLSNYAQGTTRTQRIRRRRACVTNIIFNRINRINLNISRGTDKKPRLCPPNVRGLLGCRVHRNDAPSSPHSRQISLKGLRARA